MKRRVLLALLLACCASISAGQLVLHVAEKGSYSTELNHPASIEELCTLFFDPMEINMDSLVVVTEFGEKLSAHEYLLPNKDQEVWIDEENNSTLLPKKTHIGYRDYNKETTQSNIKDILFILKSLSTKSIPWLLKNKSKLQAAGDRIDCIHPLRFLEVIFTDEELKAYLHNVRKRGGMVWSEYIGGIKESLKDEYSIDNLTKQMLLDFASNVGVNYSTLEPSFRKEKWEDFVKALIIHVPREGDSDRYDQ